MALLNQDEVERFFYKNRFTNKWIEVPEEQDVRDLAKSGIPIKKVVQKKPEKLQFTQEFEYGVIFTTCYLFQGKMCVAKGTTIGGRTEAVKKAYKNYYRAKNRAKKLGF